MIVKTLLLALSFLLLQMPAISQKQYALLIAIDDYGAPNCDSRAVDAGGRQICNLYGCVNDATSMESIISIKYGFPGQNINKLYNKSASRKNILASMDALASKCKAGDFAFIFYAGHGSQVINSKSSSLGETDKLDESIVPADTKQKGIIDIRDKELSEKFNKFLDRNIHLTVIFDCCHSASISRGEQYDTLVGRYAPNQTFDVKDASKPRIPEQRTNSKGSFLIISAAQQDQIAQEMVDKDNVHHGAFTSALITAINQLPASSSATDIFKSVKTILINNGKTNQDPAMAGQPERQKRTLFGISKAKLTDRVLLPVSAVKNGKLEFLAGFAQNLQPDNELTLIGTDGKRTTTKAIIESVDGINKSTAKLITGNISSLKPGLLFEVTNWVSPKSPLLKLCILPNQFTYKEAEDIKELALQLKRSGKANLLSDLNNRSPYLTIFYSNNKCYISSTKTGIKQILQPTPDIISQLSEGKPVYFNLPLPDNATKSIANKFKSKNFRFTNNVLEAEYMLYGILNNDNNMAYGWRSVGMNIKDSLAAMPLQTGHIALHNETDESTNQLADDLADYAMRLGKVKYWLALNGPASYKNDFPYQLRLYHGSNNKPVGAEGVRVGETTVLKLIDESKPEAKVTEKFVYVFTIDKLGNISLLFPDENDGNQGNKFPKWDKFVSWGDKVKEVELARLLQGEPVGTDQYYLIASEQQIPDYASLFNQDAVTVNKRGVDNAGDNPFDALLNISNESVSGRGKPVRTGFTWNLIKMPVTVVR